MAEKFYSVLTETGQAKIANAIALGTKINFSKMKVGDGNGNYYEPSETQTDLINTVWEGGINQVSIDNDNPNWIHLETIIPSTDGGFTIREYGVYDDVGDLLGICKCAETYKPIISDGSTKELLLDMVLCVINSDVVELKIDPTIIFAKKADVEEIRNMVIDIDYVNASGTANDILVAMGTLYDLKHKTFIAKYNNDNTKATTINGKPFYKANSTNIPTIKKGKAYEIWYDNGNGCFFLKASATGDAKADEVLAGKIVSTDEDTDIIGTMPNNTSTQNCTNVTYRSNKVIFNNIPRGYYPTTNKVQTDVSKVTSALGITADKIKDGETIGNVTGTATIQSLGGKKYKQGTVTDENDHITSYVGSNHIATRYVKITGHDFKATSGYIYTTDSNGKIQNTVIFINEDYVIWLINGRVNYIGLTIKKNVYGELLLQSNFYDSPNYTSRLTWNYMIYE